MPALECPNCGAVHERSNPGIAVIVCDRCDSTIYLEGDVLRLGVKSIVGEPRSNIRIGASGRVGDTGVEVVGRVRIVHERGAWDEWYVQTAGGPQRWLIEDEKRYALETALDHLPAGAHAGMELGDPVIVDGARFEVREVGDALCEGGQGQLPRRITPGEPLRYVDLIEIGGSRVLTFEFDPDGSGEGFIGETIPVEQVRFAGSRPPAGATGEVQAARSIECANCGAPVQLPRQGDPAKTTSCANCDAILEVDGAASVVLDFNPGREAFVLDVGDRGTLLDVEWEVVGRMKYVDDEGYWTHEYLLWAKDHGYLWLEYDCGHFSWSRPTGKGLPLAALRRAGRGTQVRFGDTTYFLQARGLSTLDYVDGALPWEARRTDQQKTWDLSNPPKLLSVEESTNELEVFEGEWLPAGTVEAAFGKKQGRSPWTVHYAQPNPWAAMRIAAFAAILMAGINVIFIGIAMVWPSTEVVSFTIPETSTGVQSVESPPFRLDPADGALIQVRYDTNVDNSWVWIDLELVDYESDTPMGAIGQEVGYYHGYDDGAWSEGSRSDSRWLKTPDAGMYALSGTLEYDRPTPVSVQIRQGGMLSRYNFCLVPVFGGIGTLFLVLFFQFENRRREDA
jgi:hypothetical protein